MDEAIYTQLMLQYCSLGVFRRDFLRIQALPKTDQPRPIYIDNEKTRIKTSSYTWSCTIAEHQINPGSHAASEAMSSSHFHERVVEKASMVEY